MTPRILFSISLLMIIVIACNTNTNQQASQKSTVENAGKYRCKPSATDKDWYSSNQKAPLFEGLNVVDFKITTKSEEAQRYFNQGLILAYGFNHAEAARSFYESTRIDPECGMCYWGFGYVLGPNYNAGMEPDNYERAYEASVKAGELSEKCNDRERALISALGKRYVETPPEDRSHLDIAYNKAMKVVFEKYPDDPDIGALYAESLMDIHPWDLYEKDTKKPKEWTPELIKTLEHLMKINPKHPGAHHFYIHAVEASASPDRGLKSAEVLGKLVPGSGHLTHMPSHIYINTGDYHEGSVANIKAVKVDSNYLEACYAQGAYPLAYYPHNWHFLTATATMEGASQIAWKAAKSVQRNTVQEIMVEPGWSTLQHYYSIPYYVAVKFAMWDKILAIAEPEESLVYPRTVLHYARGMAMLGKNDLKGAEDELGILMKLAGDSTLEEMSIWGLNSTVDLMKIAIGVLSGEIARNKQDYHTAKKNLYEAVAMEDALNYDEPPDWFFSVRHHLGATLIDAKEYVKAESVYRDDLENFPKNGWALYGLHKALQAQEKKEDALKIEREFKDAWQYADIVLASTSPYPDRN